MKKIICILFIPLLAFYATSCNNFLEKPVSADVTIDDIFSSKELATKAMLACYINLPFGLPVRGAGNGGTVRPTVGVGKGVLDNLTDLNDNPMSQASGPKDYYYNGIYNASIEQSTPRMCKYSFTVEQQWLAIRRCWTIVENIDKVPDMSPEEKEQFKAEARVIIAIHYSEMLRHLGGVPKVTHSFKADDDVLTERMTIREMIDWISELIDEAYDKLPYKYGDPNMYGRMTRLGALGLKARMLLFVASPMYNSAEAYLTDADYDANKKHYTWLGEKDNNLWKEAMDACDRVITEAQANGFGLVQPVTPDMKGYRAAYRKAYFEPDNGEQLIITRPSVEGLAYYTAPLATNGAIFMDYHRYGAYCPTQNWADMFPMMTNGYDIDPSMPNYNPANGYDNQLPNTNRDPRYYESIVTNLDEYGTGNPGIARWWNGGAEKLINNMGTHGAGTRKYHLGGQAQQNAALGKPLIWSYLRLAEIYLSYAEAANQYEGAPSALALQRVNDVRARVGLPGLPSGMGKEKFHAAVMKERCCELGFEDVRWFDIIRWKMEDVFKTRIRGTKSWIWAAMPSYNTAGKPEATRANSYGADIAGLNDNSHIWFRGDGVVGQAGVIYARLPIAADPATPASDVRPVVSSTTFDASKNVLTYGYYELTGTSERYWRNNFSSKWYLSAIASGEINKGYGLVQNPGW